ncbi:hypothetical protein ACFU93_32365 [Streptomyces sp. NPDC057611]
MTTEQQRAKKAYEAGREQRDPANVQRSQDNARIDATNTTGSRAGGSR